MGMVYRLRTKKGEWFGTEHGTGKSEKQNNFWSKATAFKGLVPKFAPWMALTILKRLCWYDHPP